MIIRSKFEYLQRTPKNEDIIIKNKKEKSFKKDRRSSHQPKEPKYI